MQIKTCPFCGGKPYIEDSQRGFVGGKSTKVCFVRCRECNARSKRVNLADYGCTSFSSKAVSDVVEAWNKRAVFEGKYNVNGRSVSEVTGGLDSD